MIEFKTQGTLFDMLRPYILREAYKVAEEVIKEKVDSYRKELEAKIMDEMKNVAFTIAKSMNDPSIKVNFAWDEKK